MLGKKSYLSQLKFDKKLNNSIVSRYLNNPRLVVLLMLIVVITGVFSYLKIPKVLNPDVKIPIVIISTILPGASPSDVESLVTVPIENAVSGLQKIDTVNSTSQESASVLTIQFLSGVDPDKATQDVQTAVSGVNNLPKDATTPKVMKLDFQNIPVWSFNITGSEDLASLMQFSTDLQNNLKDVRTISNVNLSGFETQEIQVILRPEAITSYSLNSQLLGLAINAATNSYPAGAIKTDSSVYSLTIDPEVTTVEDLRNLHILINGQPVLLSDVATIFLKSKPSQSPSYLATPTTNPVRTVRFDVYKTSSTTINQAITDAKQVTDKMVYQYNNVFSIHSILDTQDMINRQFNELVRDLIITVILVFITLLIFLGVRQAIVASLAIPFTFLITFTVMNLTGIALSFIAFFSLLLSLGLLVDDTVVVISAMTAYYKTGKFTPLETGILVWRDFITAVFTTTITTVWAFLPLLLTTGIIGDFIKPVPIVVSSALLGSFFIAMLVTMPFVIVLLNGFFPKRVTILLKILLGILILYVGSSLLPKNKLLLPEMLTFLALLFVTYQARQKLWGKVKILIFEKFSFSEKNLRASFSSGFISFDKIGSTYKRLLNKILSTGNNRKAAVVIVVLFSLFSYILFPLGFVRNEFFPSSDQNYLYVNLELPVGTNLNVANTEALSILEEIKQNPDIQFVSADVGLLISQTSGGFSSTGFNNILYTIVLPERNQRKLSSVDIAESIRNNYKNYTKGNISVTEENGGPPAGADVQIKLYGQDLGELDQLANKFISFLKNEPGLSNVDKSIKPGTSKIVFVPDGNKIADNSLTIDTVGFWLRTYSSGFSPVSIKLPGETQSKDITIRTNSTDQYAETVSSLYIPSSNGNIPISGLGTFELSSNPTIITRENEKRTISVTAGVRSGYSVSLENQKLLQFANSFQFPEGYSWSTGGVNEQNQESVISILQAMILSFVLILITMVLQFGSFRRALIVMMVIPLSISGVFIVFALLHIPLSFPALIGVLALFGIVVKNAILVVDKIMVNIREGIEYKYAIIDGAESRLEPIALTTFATILGLIPITLSNALWQGLGGAIISGLLFSGMIMLFFIPVVYYIIFRHSGKDI
jgi:multidrug efflux pump subunit AcrB